MSAPEEHRLRDGTLVLLRPIEPGDKRRLQEGLARLSPTSRFRRFMSAVPELSPRELAYLTEVDQVRHLAWIALDAQAPGQPALGVGRAIALAEPGVAEAAVTVVDSHQGRGLGTLLLGVLAREALRRGLTSFRAWVHVSNAPMLELLGELGARGTPEGEGVLRLDVPLDAPPGLETPATRVLRALARDALQALPGKGPPPDGRGGYPA